MSPLLDWLNPRLKRYRVVIKGSQIVIPSENGADPIIGFTATRFVRAATPDQAGAIAIARLRSAWNNSPYSTANRIAGPAITIVSIEHIKNPFKRSRPNKGYDFVHGHDPAW